MSNRLNKRSLLRAVQILAAKDRYLKRIVNTFGPPPLWEREQGFHTLIYIILEQQVSLASARAAYGRLVSAGHLPTPERFLKFTDARLKEMGFSRQKISYGRNLADAIVQGSINLFELNPLDDAEAKARLMEIKGIGSWTADIYLLRALGRPDIWPRGDLALAAAVQKLKGMSQPLSAEELYEMSGKWRPWRAVAARLLWHFYLKSRP